jgi:hypothetical protein
MEADAVISLLRSYFWQMRLEWFVLRLHMLDDIRRLSKSRAKLMRTVPRVSVNGDCWRN